MRMKFVRSWVFFLALLMAPSAYAGGTQLDEYIQEQIPDIRRSEAMHLQEQKKTPPRLESTGPNESKEHREAAPLSAQVEEAPISILWIEVMPDVTSVSLMSPMAHTMQFDEKLHAAFSKS